MQEKLAFTSGDDKIKSRTPFKLADFYEFW